MPVLACISLRTMVTVARVRAHWLNTNRMASARERSFTGEQCIYATTVSSVHKLAGHCDRARLFAAHLMASLTTTTLTNTTLRAVCIAPSAMTDDERLPASSPDRPQPTLTAQPPPDSMRSGYSPCRSSHVEYADTVQNSPPVHFVSFSSNFSKFARGNC